MSTPLPPPGAWMPPPPSSPPPASGPPPGPAPRRKWPFIVGAVVAVAALAVVAVVLLTGDDDAESLDTARAAATLDEVIGRSDGATVFDLEECPVDLELLARRAPGSSSIRDFVRPAEFSAVLRPDGSNISLVECSSSDDEDGLIGVSLGASPGRDSFQADLRSYVPYHNVEFDEFRSYVGGTLVTYCGTVTLDAPEGFDAFCEADWFDGEVVIGVFAGTEQATKGELETWLKSALPFLIEELAAA